MQTRNSCLLLFIVARPKMTRVGRVFKALFEKRSIFEDGFKQYLTETALHGLKYLVGTHILVKLIWVSNHQKNVL